MDMPLLKNGPMKDAPLVMEDRGDFGFGQHLLIWSWRRMAAGEASVL
ncbi:MAG: hypothetical protein ACTHPD_08630 [Rhizomicrobium sp.]